MLKKIKIQSAQNSKQGGQALLIVLLVMAVSLTVILSSVSRSVTDISNTEVEESSSRAFSAAEAGIEEALLNPPAGTIIIPVADNVEASVETKQSDPDPQGFRYPEKLKNGEQAIMWFVDHDDQGRMKCDGNCLTANQISEICWVDKESTSTNEPAVMMTIYYDPDGPAWMSGDFSKVRTATVGFDPVVSNRPSNGFIGVNGRNAGPAPGEGCKIEKERYKYQVTSIKFRDIPGIDSSCVDTPGCLIMAKLTMLNLGLPDDSEEIGFNIPGPNYPPQGVEILSTGKASETQRKIEVFKSYAEPLDIFTGALFSRDGLTKN